MKNFSFEDYAEALRGAGPKLRANILERALNDHNITLKQYARLERLAEKSEQRKAARRQPGGGAKTGSHHKISPCVSIISRAGSEIKGHRTI